jgi:hypothetical protein
MTELKSQFVLSCLSPDHLLLQHVPHEDGCGREYDGVPRYGSVSADHGHGRREGDRYRVLRVLHRPVSIIEFFGQVEFTLGMGRMHNLDTADMVA